MGRGWSEAPLCTECAPNFVPPEDCICIFSEPTHALTWNPLCEVHTHDPYDIPF